MPSQHLKEENNTIIKTSIGKAKRSRLYSVTAELLALPMFVCKALFQKVQEKRFQNTGGKANTNLMVFQNLILNSLFSFFTKSGFLIKDVQVWMMVGGFVKLLATLTLLLLLKPEAYSGRHRKQLPRNKSR